ncbi:MAG: hypothetical protein NXI04_24235 [Planctomycetaceae bacterium]|nr:hypothetical protein [Planctomycetaceae bacterium]
MSTQLHAYLDHSLGPDDIETIPRLLNKHVTATRDVEDYWRSQTPSWQLKDRPPPDSSWRECRELNLPPTELFREGEAEFRTDTLFVGFFTNIACFWSSGRFRGFLSYSKHRKVHRKVAHQLARALKSTAIAWLSELAFDPDMLVDAQSMDAVLSSLNEEMGAPQPNADTISDQVITDAKHGVPDVWYLERPPFKIETEIEPANKSVNRSGGSRRI